jgi:cytoskeletal protein RodZ
MAKLTRDSLRIIDEGEGPREPQVSLEATSGVAALLRAARQRAGIELREAADALRIRYPYLEAIEEGRFADLPGATYALGFVRAYAEYLDLDANEIVRQFKEEGKGLGRRTTLVFPEPLQEGRFPGATVLILALLLAGIAYGGWYYFEKRGSQLAGIPPLPANLAALVNKAQAPAAPKTAPTVPAAGPSNPAPAPEASAEGAPGGAAPAASAPAGTGSATGAGAGVTSTAGSEPAATPAPAAPPATASPAASTGPVTSTPPASALPVAESKPAPAPPASAAALAPSAPAPTVKPAEPAASAEPVKPAAAAAPGANGTAAGAIPAAPDQLATLKANEPHVYGESNADSRITLTAKQDSWVQVRDSESNVIWTRILKPGDSYRVPNEPGLMLLTGNAGALEVAVDGKTAPSLGAPGAVRRNIPLDPQKLLDGSAQNQ